MAYKIPAVVAGKKPPFFLEYLELRRSKFLRVSTCFLILFKFVIESGHIFFICISYFFLLFRYYFGNSPWFHGGFLCRRGLVLRLRGWPLASTWLLGRQGWGRRWRPPWRWWQRCWRPPWRWWLQRWRPPWRWCGCSLAFQHIVIVQSTMMIWRLNN